MSHSLCLPNYSVGEDCYQKIGCYARHCGKKAAVIGGKTAMEKARDALLQGIDGSGIEILDFIWYGGDCTYENGQALMDNEAVRRADMLFAWAAGAPVTCANMWPQSWINRCFCFPQWPATALPSRPSA